MIEKCNKLEFKNIIDQELQSIKNCHLNRNIYFQYVLYKSKSINKIPHIFSVDILN